MVYPYDQWIHVRVVFSGGQGNVYIESDEANNVFARISIPAETANSCYW